jgi:hypothetical protein
MAVSEYSDTVLGEINRNHKEVLFLYDMLNDKHKTIKNTVSEVVKTVKEVQETAKGAETGSFQGLKAEAVSPLNKNAGERSGNRGNLHTPDRNDGFIQKGIHDTSASVAPDPKGDKNSGTETGHGRATGQGTEETINNNKRILELYSQGQSKVSIAKELGLGVGEVKLVIDLFNNT